MLSVFLLARSFKLSPESFLDPDNNGVSPLAAACRSGNTVVVSTIMQFLGSMWNFITPENSEDDSPVWAVSWLLSTLENLPPSLEAGFVSIVLY